MTKAELDELKRIIKLLYKDGHNTKKEARIKLQTFIDKQEKEMNENESRHCYRCRNTINKK